MIFFRWKWNTKRTVLFLKSTFIIVNYTSTDTMMTDELPFCFFSPAATALLFTLFDSGTDWYRRVQYLCWLHLDNFFETSWILPSHLLGDWYGTGTRSKSIVPLLILSCCISCHIFFSCLFFSFCLLVGLWPSIMT